MTRIMSDLWTCSTLLWIAVTIWTALATVGLLKSLHFIYHHFTSPLRHLRGPKATSWMYGNIQEMLKAENSELQEEWVKQYGETLKYRGLCNNNQLFTVDTRAVNHILTHSADYQKPSYLRYHVSQVFGMGLVFAEGVQHRQQRRIMNPAFGSSQIRPLLGLFQDKAFQLCGMLSSEITRAAAEATSGVRIDVMPWLSRMTLDIISLGGFSYNINALNATEIPNELNEAFSAVILNSEKLTLLPVLQARFPILRILPTVGTRKMQAARRTILRIGNKLLLDAKASARADPTEKGDAETNSLHGRDLLSLLVKANMATGIADSQRLSDKDVLEQIQTFLVAGHETTSTAATWALYSISNVPEVQVKLRKELFSLDTETPSMEELLNLPYLDAVVRETLRLHPPVPNAGRVAMKDDVIPVGRPYKDRHGIVHDTISVRQGDMIYVPILTINRLRALWGPDAHEFKPERWKDIPDAVSKIPGVWAHQMTFLGGPRACIGYRFTLAEIKAFLFTFVRTFEFQLAVPASDIGATSTMVRRPSLRSDPNRKRQLPLLLKPYKRN